MQKNSFFYCLFLGIILLQSSFSYAMTQYSQPPEEPSCSEETEKKRSFLDRHKRHAEEIQTQLYELRIKRDSAAQSSAKSLPRYYEILSQIEHLENKEAKLKKLYTALGLNYEAPDPTLVVSKQKELEGRREDLLRRVSTLMSHTSLPLEARDLLNKHQNTLLNVNSILETLSRTPESYFLEIKELTARSKMLKLLLRAPETYLKEIDLLLHIKVATNVSLNAHHKDPRKKLPQDSAISQERVLSLVQTALGIPPEIFESIYSQSLYRIILGAIEGLDPLDEDQKDDVIGTTLQTLKMMIKGFRVKFTRDLTGFSYLISRLSPDMRELSEINDRLNPSEQELYKSVISPEFEERPELTRIFSSSSPCKAGQEAFLAIIKEGGYYESVFSQPPVTTWLPFAIPETQAGMMHRLIGAFHGKTYHSWEDYIDPCDKILTLPPFPIFSGPEALTHLNASELFLSSVHTIIAHHLNLKILTHIEESISSLVVESEVPPDGAAGRSKKEDSEAKRRRDNELP
ncbi:MAG TPA: hypothetical protein PLY23_09160 [Alphaproteobacteria bacterium]|nr:hypothetical protein [Alphaproteobacteria bacterium]HQS94776.1 hypothetical protein [Alphaproteobacteria bacterium]